MSKTADDGYELTAIHIMAEPQISSATVTGKINAIDVDKRIFNISRGPIEKWNRPAATMDFMVADNITMPDFSLGDSVTFTFEVRDELVITEIAHGTNEHNTQQGENTVDHSNH